MRLLLSTLEDRYPYDVTPRQTIVDTFGPLFAGVEGEFEYALNFDTDWLIDFIYSVPDAYIIFKEMLLGLTLWYKPSREFHWYSERILELLEVDRLIQQDIEEVFVKDIPNDLLEQYSRFRGRDLGQTDEEEEEARRYYDPLRDPLGPENIKGKLLNVGTLPVALENLIGSRVAVLGISGSGKTNTAAVLIEELLNYGVPMTIVDIEGEYWGLRERYNILVAGVGKNVDLEVGFGQAEELAVYSVRQGLPIILDLSEFGQEEAENFLLAYFTALWETARQVRRPYQVIIEEAHEFVPQGTRSPLKSILTRMMLRGRKRGIGVILMSQRSAKLEKDLLTQAGLLFLHQVVHPVDLRVYHQLIPLKPNDINNVVGGLNPGQVLVVQQHKPTLVNIRKRHTLHVGNTPGWDDTNLPDLRKIDSSLLQELREVLFDDQPTANPGVRFSA